MCRNHMVWGRVPMITKLTNLHIDLMSIDGQAGRWAADVPSMHQGLKSRDKNSQSTKSATLHRKVWTNVKIDTITILLSLSIT
jgi:hypothetical protein